MDYLNFDPVVERAEPGYHVRVGSPMGQALRTLAERDILAQTKEAFTAYLDRGAPLGGRDEIEAFLRSREAEEPSLTR